MTRANEIIWISVALLAMSACADNDSAENSAATAGGGDAEVVRTDKKSSDDLAGATVTPGAPYRVSYRIVGTAVVGVPVTVDLTVESLRGPQPVILDYRINDTSAMALGEAQPAQVQMEAADNESRFRQQVTVVPQREGRFYLNVSASVETESGTMSTITAIPIQVGSGTRELQPNGEVQLDESGEQVRVLSQD